MVSPDCRRPVQDQNRRELLPKTYESMFSAIQTKKDVKVVAAAPFSMDIFSYPHREGAKMTFSLILGWLSSDECNIEEKFCPTNPDGNKFMIIKDYKNMISMDLKNSGNIVLVIGKTIGHLEQSIFAREILSEKKGPPPAVSYTHLTLPTKA